MISLNEDEVWQGFKLDNALIRLRDAFYRVGCVVDLTLDNEKPNKAFLGITDRDGKVTLVKVSVKDNFSLRFDPVGEKQKSTVKVDYMPEDGKKDVAKFTYGDGDMVQQTEDIAKAICEHEGLNHPALNCETLS